MTLNDVFLRLSSIDEQATSLLRDTGHFSGDGLDTSVPLLADGAEDAFLRNIAEGLMDALLGLHETLAYLKKTLRGEYILGVFPSDRYGYWDEDGQPHVFSCGMALEARICDPFGQQRWVRARIGHNGYGYFLWGFDYVPLDGLLIRVRGEHA